MNLEFKLNPINGKVLAGLNVSLPSVSKFPELCLSPQVEPRPKLASSSLPIFIWAWLTWEIQAPAAQHFPKSHSEGRHQVVETDLRLQPFPGTRVSFVPTDLWPHSRRAAPRSGHSSKGCVAVSEAASGHLPPACLLWGSAKQMPEAASLKPAREIMPVCCFHVFSRGGTCKTGTIPCSEVNTAAAAVGPWAASNAVLEMKCAGKTKGLDLRW